MEISVAVFDDNKNQRSGLKLLIDSTKDMKCVGTFEDCSNVISDITACNPDVVLMDIDMPKVNGIEGLKLIRNYFPDVKILMQTVFEDDEKIFDSICAGADGYILKKTSPTKLLESIREVVEGGAPMTPSIARQVLRKFTKENKNSGNTHFDLSARELEILSILVQGLSYKMIAEKCNISYTTVNTHIKHIYEKLHVHSAPEAIAKALDHKIV